jgi:hypothetical protein
MMTLIGQWSSDDGYDLLELADIDETDVDLPLSWFGGDRAAKRRLIFLRTGCLGDCYERSNDLISLGPDKLNFVPINRDIRSRSGFASAASQRTGQKDRSESRMKALGGRTAAEKVRSGAE